MLAKKNLLLSYTDSITCAILPNTDALTPTQITTSFHTKQPATQVTNIFFPSCIGKNQTYRVTVSFQNSKIETNIVFPIH